VGVGVGNAFQYDALKAILRTCCSNRKGECGIHRHVHIAMYLYLFILATILGSCNIKQVNENTPFFLLPEICSYKW
jgi:hypothetical protein